MATSVLNQKDLIDRYKSIYFVPDYLLDALNERKITLDYIDSETHKWAMTRKYNRLVSVPNGVDGIDNEDIMFRPEQINQIDGHATVNDKPGLGSINNSEDPNSLPNRLFRSLSKTDLRDWVKLNEMMRSLLLAGRLSDNSMLTGFLAKPYEYIEYPIIGQMPDSKTTYASILDIYSNSDVTDGVIMNGYKVYSVVPTNYTMFVVLHSGFSNILSSSRVELRTHFFRSLMEDLLKAFGIDVVVHLDIFAAYMRCLFRNESKVSAVR